MEGMGGDVGGVERVGHRDRSGGGGAKIRERCCWLHPADSEGQPREGWGGRWGWGRSALGEELGEEGWGDGLPRRTATAFPALQHGPAARGPERKCRADRAPAALGPDCRVSGLHQAAITAKPMDALTWMASTCKEVGKQL